MRKLITVSIIVLLFAAVATAVEWRVTNQATVSWDPVMTLENGDPLPATDSIKYKVYLSNAATDPGKTNPVLLGETDQTQYTLTLNTEGKFIVGVTAVRYNESAEEVGESEINWSDVNGAATPNPFGLLFYHPPASPVNLR